MGLSSREWIRETLAHRETGGVPYNFKFTPMAAEKLQQYYGTSDLEAVMRLPIRMGAPVRLKPQYADPDVFGETIADEFGVTWSTSKIDRGAPIGPALREPSLAGYSFPDPHAPGRFDLLGDWCDNHKEHSTFIWVGDLWERATFIRGMEEILLDLVTEPAFVSELLRGLADYILQTMTILFDRFSFDAIAVSDDYGTQRSMIMSPSHWKQFIKPLLSEIYSLAHSHNRIVFHHTCGNVRPIIGDMIDTGLDILHPIQPEAMDIFELKREFGNHVTFCGGVPTQDLLPNGTPEEVRAEVRRLKQMMGRGGGYILEPGITIQADVPLENIIAMIEEAAQDTRQA